MYLNLEAQVILDDLDISAYVIEIKKNQTLCGIMQTFNITLDKTVLDYLNANSIELKPSNTLIIYEFGTKVLTGHVRSVKRARNPDYVIQIDGTDKYKYAKDYFIDESFGTSNGESVLYWTTSLLNLAGLDLIVDNNQISERTVGPGIEFTLRTVDDALTEVISYAGGYLYTDPDGIIHIQKGTIDSDIIFTGGTPDNTDIYNPTLVSGYNITRATHKYNDENTRDRAKVWGFKGNVILRPNESPYITSENSVDLNLPVPKTVIYASNYVQTQGEADRLSSDIIEALGKFDSIKVLETVGNPNIRVGKSAYVNVDLETSQITETCSITGVASDLSKDGYTMQITLDEFCPKFAGWELSQLTYPLYAGTFKHGIYRSPDNGVTWIDFNVGLPVGDKYVRKMAYNYLDEGMAIVNGNLYHSDGTGWTAITLPVPVNSAGDTPAPTSSVPVGVDSLGAGTFNVLTTATYDHAYQGSGLPLKNRSWLYTSTNGGLTPADWTSEAVHDNTDYNYYGLDVNSKNGFPYILVNNPSDPIPYLASVSFKIGGSTLIHRGSNISGNTGVRCTQVSADDDTGFVPHTRRSSETSRILRSYFNTVSNGWNVVIRLVLGANYPGIPSKCGGNWLIPNLYFRPFVGFVAGNPGYHGAGLDNNGPGYSGHYLTSDEICRGYIDYDLAISGTSPLPGPIGKNYCFFVGHSTTLPDGTVSSVMAFNLEPKYFEGTIFPLTDPNLDIHLQGLATGFYNYPFNLNNLNGSDT